jgi:hypothetical protein
MQTTAPHLTLGTRKAVALASSLAYLGKGNFYKRFAAQLQKQATQATQATQAKVLQTLAQQALNRSFTI